MLGIDPTTISSPQKDDLTHFSLRFASMIAVFPGGKIPKSSTIKLHDSLVAATSPYLVLTGIPHRRESVHPN